LILRPAVFGGHVLTLGVTGLLQALAKCTQKLGDCVTGDLGSRNPITGIAVFCARTEGEKAEEVRPPMSAMNSRRLIITSRM
jgi:hypothetical protein